MRRERAREREERMRSGERVRRLHGHVHRKTDRKTDRKTEGCDTTISHLVYK